MVAKATSGTGFPAIDPASVATTRESLHGYARVLGDVLKTCRQRRKHWWHASLKPSLRGLSTGVVRGTRDFEIVLDLHNGQCRARSTDGETLDVNLLGQSASALATSLADFLTDVGVDPDLIKTFVNAERTVGENENYNSSATSNIGQALAVVAASLEQFRATIPEETSSVQLWPHHFDLSMIWLPGEKIAGQDPGNEEYSDKQMNFGFGFGDEVCEEPYFYVTAYPTPEDMPSVYLPGGAQWKLDGFSGVVVPYARVAEHEYPNGYLQELWTILLTLGREKMLESK